MQHIPVTGQVMIKKNGVVLYSGKNLVVTLGYNLLAGIIGSTATKPSHMAFGDDATAVSVGQTALIGTEHERVALNSTAVADAVITYVATFGGLAGSQTCREMAIFNAVSGGTMLCRFLTQEFTISNGDAVIVTWAVSIGD